MPGVEYNVNLTLTGAGAEQAIVQLRALQGQFVSTATAGAAMGAAATRSVSGVTALSAGTRALRAEVRAMSGALTLAGVQSFPELTMGAMIAQQAMRGLKVAAAETGIGLATLTAGTVAGLAGLYEIGIFIKENIGLWQDVTAEEKAQTGAFETAAMQMRRTYDLAITAVTEGRLKLTESEAEWMDQLMSRPTPERAQLLQQFVHKQLPAGEFMSESDKSRQVRAEMQAMELSQENSRVTIQFLNRVVPIEARRITIQSEFSDKLREINSLLEREMITEEQARELRTRADIERMQGLTQLRDHLTDLQELQKQIGQEFASGLSSALVRTFREGGKAMKEFAANFFAMAAQMILQMLILRALKSIFGSFAGGGVAMAAQGGFYPRYAAAGVSGVSSVSRPTYFPKFNVLAGEAGREMLTVLARPRLMSIGGLEAVVGNAGGQRLAITSADQLAGGGAGGRMVIEIRHSEASEARLVSTSVQQAEIRITQQAQRPSKFREAIKRNS